MSLRSLAASPSSRRFRLPFVGNAQGAKVALSALLGLLLLACTTATFVIQQYEGNPLPNTRIAVLRILGGGDAYLAALDGEQLGFQLEDPRDRIHVEMLPGRHVISVGQVKDERVVTRAFQAEAGHTYRAVIIKDRLARDALGRPTWTLGVYDVDPETDELRHDVSQSPDLLPPAPVAPPTPSPTPAPTALPTAPPADTPPPAPTSHVPPVPPAASASPTASAAPAPGAAPSAATTAAASGAASAPPPPPSGVNPPAVNPPAVNPPAVNPPAVSPPAVSPPAVSPAQPTSPTPAPGARP